MHLIGKIDKTKLGEFGKNIITEEVILTEERKKHIMERHPNLLEDGLENIKDVLIAPSYIFQDRKNKDTVLLAREMNKQGKIYRLVINYPAASDGVFSCMPYSKI